MLQGMRAINGIAEKGDTAKYGAVIRGTAGNGKSCLAGKLIGRFSYREDPDKELVAFHGKVSDADVIIGFRRLFKKRGNDDAANILESDAGYDKKIKALFRGPFREVPSIIYFDDFEQNLKPLVLRSTVPA